MVVKRAVRMPLEWCLVSANVQQESELMESASFYRVFVFVLLISIFWQRSLQFLILDRRPFSDATTT